MIKKNLKYSLVPLGLAVVTASTALTNVGANFGIIMSHYMNFMQHAFFIICK